MNIPSMINVRFDYRNGYFKNAKLPIRPLVGELINIKVLGEQVRFHCDSIVLTENYSVVEIRISVARADTILEVRDKIRKDPNWTNK